LLNNPRDSERATRAADRGAADDALGKRQKRLPL